MNRNWINRLLGKERQDESSKKEDLTAATMTYAGFDACKVIEKILGNAQIHWDRHQLPSKTEYDYHFGFQRGDFHAYVNSARHNVRVVFLFFFDAPMGQLDDVRDTCNYINSEYPDYKAIYAINEEKHTIYLHLQTSIRLTPYNDNLLSDFTDMLSGCFALARDYRGRFAEITKNNQSNLEEKRSYTIRERYLAHETEMQNGLFRWRVYDTEHLILSDLLYAFFETRDINFRSLSITTDEFQVIDDADTIKDFDITRLLVDDAVDDENYHDDLKFSREEATLVLKAKVHELSEQTFILHFAAEAEAETALYIRATIVQPDRELSPVHSLQRKESKEQRSYSFLMSYSKMRHQQKQAAFEYYYDDLQMRCLNNGELSEEDKFICNTEESNVAYNLYWGRRFYLAERYYEALLHLENAYYPCRDRFAGADSQKKAEFYELSYYIGMCYSKLGMPERAYYFLDGLFNLNNVRYTTAYINALVAAKDYRTIGILRRLISNLQTMMKDQSNQISDEQRDYLKDFILFLRRSKARTLIDNGKFDEAETEIKAILPQESKEHERYLLEELAFIAQTRSHKAQTDDTRSISADFPLDNSSIQEDKGSADSDADADSNSGESSSADDFQNPL